MAGQQLELKLSTDGHFFFNLIGVDGKVIEQSQFYETKAAARKAMRDVCKFPTVEPAALASVLDNT